MNQKKTSNMTQEEKARAYDEALERARKMLNMILDNELLGFPDQIREIFPQLRESESEDERIRKFLIDLVSTMNWRVNWPEDKVKEEKVKCLAWIEKQKEPKWSPSEGEMGVLYKLCYISNQITDEDDTELTRLYQDLKREYFNGHSFENMFSNERQKESLHIPETCKENADSFTDIKDRNIRGCIGMALADVSESRFKMYGVTLKECLAYLEKQKDPENVSASTMVPSCWAEEPSLQKEQKPADLSEMMVHKEPYIAPVPTPMVADEQKPDTRDADDLQLLGFIYDLLNEIEWKDNWAMSKDECLRRLNNYRPEKSAEWGEEDNEMYINVASSLRGYACGLKNEEHKKHIQKGLDWLENRFKSLRPSWKPNEEQMEALEKTIRLANFGTDEERRKALASLCEHLKKLGVKENPEYYQHFDPDC